MSHTGTAHPFHMWTKFGDDMSKRSWVMLDKTDRQTDSQTDRQTDKRTYLPNCKFWQVITRQIKLDITKVLCVSMRLSWSREPFSCWSVFNCFPTLIHMFKTWPSKVNLSSICPVLLLCRRTVQRHYKQWHSIQYLWCYCFWQAWFKI